jgi:aminoglycoside/choline kinase family phosphotransferase
VPTPDPPILDWVLRHAPPGRRVTGTERLTGGYVNDNVLIVTDTGVRQLVHADFNPKNILVRGASVAAVLDWEFAFSGTPLFDVGNMLRFAERYPPGYLLTRPPDHPYFQRARERLLEETRDA